MKRFVVGKPRLSGVEEVRRLLNALQEIHGRPRASSQKKSVPHQGEKERARRRKKTEKE